MTEQEGHRLLEAFFAAPNQLRLDAINEQTDAASGRRRLLTDLIADVHADDGRPLLLPRAEADRTVWYALLPDRRLRRLVSEDIKAFIGATYADVDELSQPLSRSDPIDLAALAWVGGTGVALRFNVASAQRAGAMDAIEAMHRAWSERPKHLVRPPDGTAPLLRALNRAIARKDAALADDALDRIRNSGRLSTANMTFATIRVLEVAEQWSQILEMDELWLVLAIPRPRAVTEALLRSVYWCQVANTLPLSASPDDARLQAALTLMSSTVLPPYAGLFRAADGLKAGEALLLFALRAALAGPSHVAEVEQLAAQCDADDPALPAILALRQRAQHVSTTEDAAAAEAAFAAPAVNAELRQAHAAAEAHIRDAQAALEAFGRGPSVETASAALAVLGVLSPAESERLLTVNRYQTTIRRVQNLLPLGSKELPDGWGPWASALRAQPDWPGAVDVLDIAADSWSIESMLQSGRAQDLAVTLMDARSQGGRGAAARALDYLLPATEGGVAQGHDLTVLSTHLITVLLADDIVTEADWNFIVGLLACVLEGIEVARYREAIDEIRSGLVDRASPAVIDPALAVLEVLSFHFAPDPEARDDLASVVIGLCERFGHRLHRDQLVILQLSCRDIGGDHEARVAELLARLLSDTTGSLSAEATVLNGQSVGIYSLDAAAAQRAKVAIEAAYVGVEVETNAAEVATRGLRRLAQTADFMIVATRAAKHAATLEIDEILRKRGQRPVFPAGKGATSIVRALRERLAEA
jgi:hypothetical protein